jgi:hypothetical protein
MYIVLYMYIVLFGTYEIEIYFDIFPDVLKLLFNL